MSARILEHKNKRTDILATINSLLKSGIKKFEIVEEGKEWDLYPGDIIKKKKESQEGDIHTQNISFACKEKEKIQYQCQQFYEMGNSYFDQGKHTKALMCYKNALKMDVASLNLKIEFKISICAYYAGELDIGRKYTDRIIIHSSSSEEWVNQSLSNYEFYLEPLPTIKDQVLDLGMVIEKKLPEWKSLNPSIIPRQKGGFWVNLRLVNWKVNPVGFNKYTTPDGKFRTKNALGWIQKDERGDISWGKEPLVISKSDFTYKKIRKDSVTGFEDIRLFSETDQHLHFICNCTKNHPKGRGRLSLGSINNPDTSSGPPKYIHLNPIVGYEDDKTQKNWLCCSSKKEESSEMNFIYGYNPFTKVVVDLKTATARPLTTKDLPFHLQQFRGSAGPIRFSFEEGGEYTASVSYILVIHQVYFKNHGGRRYLHRFVFLDHEHVPVGLSRPWFLKSDSIEYVSSIVRADKEKIYIGYGYMDAQARIAQVKIKHIQKMFIPLSEYL